MNGGTKGYSARLLIAPRTLRAERVELPRLAADRVRIRFLFCGICGSDLSMFEGRRRIDYPVSLGHEFVAEVVSVGEQVENTAPGEFVTSDLNYRCGTCDHCRAGRSHLCRRSGDGLFSNRGFAELADIHAGYLTRLEAPHRRLALTEPLSCVLHAKRWVDPVPSERVLVIGAGGLGSCLAFALYDASVSFEIFEIMPDRRAMIAPVVEPLGRAVASPEGEYDAVFDLSGAESGLRLACESVRSGGRLCTMSHLDGYSNADFLLAALTRRDIAFKVSYINGERATMDVAAQLLTRSWGSRWERLIEVVPLEHLQAAFEGRRTSPRCQTLVQVAIPAGEH